MFSYDPRGQRLQEQTHSDVALTSKLTKRSQISEENQGLLTFRRSERGLGNRYSDPIAKVQEQTHFSAPPRSDPERCAKDLDGTRRMSKMKEQTHLMLINKEFFDFDHLNTDRSRAAADPDCTKREQKNKATWPGLPT